MGMAKIPTRMSWEKITWHKKNRRKEKTISKIIKWLILLLLKLKDDELLL